jgi:hypothetical protein
MMSLPETTESDDAVETQRKSSGQAFMAGTGQTSGGGESVRRAGVTVTTASAAETDESSTAYSEAIVSHASERKRESESESEGEFVCV